MQTKKTELDYYFQVLLIGDSSYERNQFLEYILKNRKKKEEDILTDDYLTIIDYYDEKKVLYIVKSCESKEDTFNSIEKILKEMNI